MWSGPATGLWSVATCDQCKVPFVVYIVVFPSFKRIICLCFKLPLVKIKIATVRR